jgi:hypothetical protein
MDSRLRGNDNEQYVSGILFGARFLDPPAADSA